MIHCELVILIDEITGLNSAASSLSVSLNFAVISEACRRL